MTRLRIFFAALAFGGGLALGKWAPWSSPSVSRASAGDPAKSAPGGNAVTQSSPVHQRGTDRNSDPAEAAVHAPAGPGSSSPAGTPASIEAIAAEPSALRRRVLAKRYFDQLSAGDFAALLPAVTALDNSEVLSMFFLGWTAKDPAAALDAIDALPAYRSSLLARCLSAWARADLAAATKWSERLTGREKSAIDHMLQQIAGRSAQPAGQPAKPADPTAGLPPKDRFWSYVTLSENGVGFSDMEGRVLPALRDWVRQDPVEASEAILKSRALRRNEELLRAVYEAWKANDPAGADQFLSTLPAESARILVRALALEASKTDIATARLIAERLPDLRQRSRVLIEIGAKIAAENPSQAPGWIESLQQADPNFLPMSIFREWFKADPATAAQALLEHPAYQKIRAERPHDGFMANYFDFRPWVEKDSAAAARYIANLSKGDRATALYNLGNHWVEKDAAGAIQFARSLPTPEAQDEALRQFTFSLAKSSAVGVTQHLESLPAGSGKSAAIEGFAFATFDVDPDAVLEWVRAIPEESKRLDVLTRAWADWREKNPRAANDWLENVGQFKPAERQALERKGAGF